MTNSRKLRKGDDLVKSKRKDDLFIHSLYEGHRRRRKIESLDKNTKLSSPLKTFKLPSPNQKKEENFVYVLKVYLENIWNIWRQQIKINWMKKFF